jgi:ornithine carbamoyltransferase
VRHFLSLSDAGATGVQQIVALAEHFKRTRGDMSQRQLLAGRTIALVFEKASTRTRISLEVAVAELGGHPLVLSRAGSQMDRGEPIEDTARVLSRMVHAITFRTFSDASLRRLADYSTVPVLNALTDAAHPMQLLADLQTIKAEFGSFEGLKCVWVGDGNNMANSWIEAAGLLGFQLVLACPEGYDPDAHVLEQARNLGAQVTIERDPFRACYGAHVVNTDVFTSMGQEAETERRSKAFIGYKVTERMLRDAREDAIVLHCLPAHRGEEIDAEVIDGPRSRVWDQAEARLHTSKAVLCWALNVRT